MKTLIFLISLVFHSTIGMTITTTLKNDLPDLSSTEALPTLPTIPSTIGPTTTDFRKSYKVAYDSETFNGEYLGEGLSDGKYKETSQDKNEGQLETKSWKAEDIESPSKEVGLDDGQYKADMINEERNDEGLDNGQYKADMMNEEKNDEGLDDGQYKSDVMNEEKNDEGLDGMDDGQYKEDSQDKDKMVTPVEIKDSTPASSTPTLVLHTNPLTELRPRALIASAPIHPIVYDPIYEPEVVLVY